MSQPEIYCLLRQRVLLFYGEQNWTQNKLLMDACKQWIQLLCCFTMVNPTAFFLNYCSIVKCMHEKLFVSLFCQCTCVKTANKIMLRLIPCPCDTSPMWKIKGDSSSNDWIFLAKSRGYWSKPTQVSGVLLYRLTIANFVTNKTLFNMVTVSTNQHLN